MPSELKTSQILFPDCKTTRSDKPLCVTPVQASDGDNGGPVIQNGKVIGVTSISNSYDPDKDEPRPLVFTPVSQYADWIESIIKA